MRTPMVALIVAVTAALSFILPVSGAGQMTAPSLIGPTAADTLSPVTYTASVTNDGDAALPGYWVEMHIYPLSSASWSSSDSSVACIQKRPRFQPSYWYCSSASSFDSGATVTISITGTFNNAADGTEYARDASGTSNILCVHVGELLDGDLVDLARATS